jgi:hypothetical protein
MEWIVEADAAPYPSPYSLANFRLFIALRGSLRRNCHELQALSADIAI